MRETEKIRLSNDENPKLKNQSSDVKEVALMSMRFPGSSFNRLWNFFFAFFDKAYHLPRDLPLSASWGQTKGSP